MADQTKAPIKGQDAGKAQERTKHPEPPVQEQAQGLGGEAVALAPILGDSAMELPVERHAALLGDPRFAHPANAIQRARMVSELQRSYGNAHMQRVVDRIQTKRDGELSDAELPDGSANTIAVERGLGRSPDPETRSRTELSSGYDFGNAPSHIGTSVNRLRRDLDAVALTTGNESRLREGGYELASEYGKDFIGHDLTHGAEQNPTNELQTKAVDDNTLIQAKGEGFKKIIVEDVEITKAPGKIELPKELMKGMLQSWKKSLPKGKSLEQGGILVRKKNGSYEWKPGKPGTSGAFTPNYGDVEADEKLVAVGHTHPYSKSEGGHTGVSFSGGDLASIVYEKNQLNIVRSGKTLFVLARAAKFNKLVKGLGAVGKKNLHDKIEALWDKVFSAHQGNVKQSAHAATKAVCKKYHLIYYRGKGATLKKVDTSK